jgi:uncharacterized membrane protein
MNNSKNLTIAVVAAVAVMLVATSAVATEDAFAGKKKYKTQAITQANDCGNGKLPLNVGCQNTASQVQGDENVVSQAAEQAFGGGGYDDKGGKGDW